MATSGEKLPSVARPHAATVLPRISLTVTSDPWFWGHRVIVPQGVVPGRVRSSMLANFIYPRRRWEPPRQRPAVDSRPHLYNLETTMPPVQRSASEAHPALNIASLENIPADGTGNPIDNTAIVGALLCQHLAPYRAQVCGELRVRAFRSG